MPKVLVIIVSYNFERWIERCLGSLRRSHTPADVLVVDNASSDRTVSLIEQYYPEVRLIRSDRNLGFGRANNLSMQIALQEGYEWVFLLNQDAWIDERTIGRLVELGEAHPEYGILSPVHLTGSGDKPDHGFAQYSGLTDLQALHSQTSTTTGLTEVPFVNAAFWMIPVRVLRRVGGFSPLFYHYGEDVDFVNRLHYHGYRVAYAPDVFGCHDREYRPVSREAWLRSERVYLLSEYANPNRSTLSAFAYGVLAGIKKALKALLQGEGKNVVAFIGITCHLLGCTRKVLYYRAEGKRQQPSYIIDNHL